MSDPISDLLTVVRNGNRKSFENVDIPSSKFKVSLLRLLKAEGFISNYKVMEDGQKRPFVRIYLKYGTAKQPVLLGLRRVSRPGLRVYKPYSLFSRRSQSSVVTIVSTPKGLLTDRQAYQAKVGGEVLCQVW